MRIYIKAKSAEKKPFSLICHCISHMLALVSSSLLTVPLKQNIVEISYLSHVLWVSLQAEFPANTNILYVDLPSAELIASSKDARSLPGMVLNVKKPITFVDEFGMKQRCKLMTWHYCFEEFISSIIVILLS